MFIVPRGTFLRLLFYSVMVSEAEPMTEHGSASLTMTCLSLGSLLSKRLFLFVPRGTFYF
jgi:hypothetical protein